MSRETALERIRTIALALPETVEQPNHSHASWVVRGKTFAMFLDNHHGDGRLAIWCKAAPGAQDLFVRGDPARFFIPPYVGPRGWVGVRLEGKAPWPVITDLIQRGWAMSAPKRLLAATTEKPVKKAPARKERPTRKRK